jgi:Subtilisin-like serine proteases
MSGRQRILVEVDARDASGLEAGLERWLEPQTLAAEFPGLELDLAAEPIPLEREPSDYYHRRDLELDLGAVESGAPLTRRLISGSVPFESRIKLAARIRTAQGVRGVFSSPPIRAAAVCDDSPGIGTAADAKAILGADSLVAAGLDGGGATVAIADAGINVAHLRAFGQKGSINYPACSSPANVATRPGEHAVGHGTMCAFQIGLAAPEADLADCPVLLSGGADLAGWLDDILRAFTDLRTFHTSHRDRPLIVSNSWAVIDPTLDFPVGDAGNYTDNVRHPLSTLMRQMAADGIDLVFAAGNCGLDCGNRCGFGAEPPINGANSHADALCVGAADVQGHRAGYSSVGPGRLDREKPDLLGPSHYAGSNALGSVDGGTSTACPAVAGLIASVRTRYRADLVNPAELRRLLRESSRRAPGTSYDVRTGWGLIDGAALLARLEAEFGNPSV